MVAAIEADTDRLALGPWRALGDARLRPAGRAAGAGAPRGRRGGGLAGRQPDRRPRPRPDRQVTRARSAGKRLVRPVVEHRRGTGPSRPRRRRTGCRAAPGPSRTRSGVRKSGTTPAVDQRLGQLPRLRVGEGDVRAAAGRRPAGRPARRRAGRARRRRGHDQVGHARGPSRPAARCPPRRPAGRRPRPRPSPSTGGVPTPNRSMPVGRLVGRPHRELVALAEPALDRRAQPLLQVAAHVEERRRPRAAVEVLVGAAHGQVGAGVGQPDRHRADRVREVPEHAARRRRAPAG